MKGCSNEEHELDMNLYQVSVPAEAENTRKEDGGSGLLVLFKLLWLKIPGGRRLSPGYNTKVH